ncbi:MAG: response regulator transcription factor [Chitinophagaceae bacterium]|nr:response regulator transcription factor [Chitinophagaceae bacterium]MCB9044667.1 response regulator transcription factor [Chitinophagales bacterium]
MGNTIKIALADDHNLFRKGVEELIEDFDNMEVLYSLPNGQELINRLSSAKVLPDVCLLDINMPQMNGFETAAAIKERWPDIKIIAVSVYDSEFNIIGMLRAGAGGYILKDAQPDALKAAIEGVYNNGFYHSEMVTGKILHQLISQPKEVSSSQLNEKEIQFLKLCCSELTYKEIADEMGISHRTIDGYRDQLFYKLNIKSRTGLVMYALKTGISTLDA